GSFTVMSVISNPLLGAFILGIFIPPANTAGVFSGLAAGFVISLWVSVGGILYPPSPEIMGILPFNTGSCQLSDNSNATVNGSIWLPETGASTSGSKNRASIADVFYALSYLYYGILGTLTTVVVGIGVSYLTGPTKREEIAKGLLWWDLSEMEAVSDKTEQLRNREVPVLQSNQPMLKRRGSTTSILRAPDEAGREELLVQPEESIHWDAHMGENRSAILDETYLSSLTETCV
ncbi:hypothetical protein scyTo_0019914, partial [Scyliorhinus torazame]|nr:hypothetical protein [Scyliorhinus torazame]